MELLNINNIDFKLLWSWIVELTSAREYELHNVEELVTN